MMEQNRVEIHVAGHLGTQLFCYFTAQTQFLQVKDAISEQQGNGEETLHVWKDGERQGVANSDHPYFTQKELKDALKKFKASQDDVKDKEAVSKFTSIHFSSL